MIALLVLKMEQLFLRTIAADVNAYTNLVENDNPWCFLRKTFVHGSAVILGVICYPYR